MKSQSGSFCPSFETEDVFHIFDNLSHVIIFQIILFTEPIFQILPQRNAENMHGYGRNLHTVKVVISVKWFLKSLNVFFFSFFAIKAAQMAFVMQEFKHDNLTKQTNILLTVG